MTRIPPKPRLLLLTDSLGNPRRVPQEVPFEKAWPQLLKADGDYDIHQISIGGGTSRDLVNQVSYAKMFGPDVVVVQVGTVDSAPRFMYRWEIDQARTQGAEGLERIKQMNTPKVIASRNITYVAPKAFDANTRKLEGSFGAPVIFIGILPARPEYEEILPGVTRRFTEYNEILKSRGHYISMDDCDTSMIMSDHHHPNVEGHQEIHDRVAARLRKVLKRTRPEPPASVTSRMKSALARRLRRWGRH
jgi:lysophospholipase L1-like esterase